MPSTHTSRATPARTQTTRSRRAAERSQDAVAFLKEQHREVGALFKQFEKLGESGPAGEKELIVRRACEELTVHATIEEELFYPAARSVKGADSLLNEADVEHASLKDLIGKLDGMDPSDELFDASFTVLAEYVKHHVKEEEGELFPKVKKSDLDLVELGAQLADRAEALLEGES